MSTLGSLGIVPAAAPFVCLLLIDKCTLKSWCLAISATIPVIVLQAIALIHIVHPPVSATIAIILVLTFFGCVLGMVYDDNKHFAKGWSVFKDGRVYYFGGISLLFILANLYTILYN